MDSENNAAKEPKIGSEIGGSKERNIWVRALAGWLWFYLILCALNGLIGGIVGAIAGWGRATLEEGGAAGTAAATIFYQKYGALVSMIQPFIVLFLFFSESLPGISKYKKEKHVK